MSNTKDIQFNQILDVIYDQIFIRMQQSNLDIFLCGGMSTKNKLSIRDKLRKELVSEKNFRVLYPEDLFADILSTSKDNDLLSLEQILADNCDCICIVCESVGSFVELGAFTNNPGTFPKVIALIKTKYKNEHSFVILGPIKYIQSKDKDNVIFYNANLSNAKKQLVRTLRKRKAYKVLKKLNTIIGLNYFLLLSLYYFRNVEINKIIDSLKTIMVKNGFALSSVDFDILFKSAMKLLYKEKSVERYSEDSKEYYRITNRGLLLCQGLIATIETYDKYKLFDKIRLQVLKYNYY